MLVSLFRLSGGGDNYVFLAPRQAYDWMVAQQAPDTVDTLSMPDSLVAELGPFLGPEGYENEIEVTSGSCTNDIALHFAMMFQHYDSFQKLKDVIDQNHWTVSADEFVGYIY